MTIHIWNKAVILTIFSNNQSSHKQLATQSSYSYDYSNAKQVSQQSYKHQQFSMDQEKMRSSELFFLDGTGISWRSSHHCSDTLLVWWQEGHPVSNEPKMLSFEQHSTKGRNCGVMRQLNKKPSACNQLVVVILSTVLDDHRTII